MALLDIFKKKKKGEKKPLKKKVEAKPLQPKPTRAAPKKKAAAKKKAALKEGKKSGGRAYQILKTPHVTEKATSLTSKNQYVFKVWPRANKVEVKKAVEDIFGVDVVSVKIVNVTEKRRRLGRVEGFRSGYKKAIVRLKEGQKIEILPR